MIKAIRLESSNLSLSCFNNAVTLPDLEEQLFGMGFTVTFGFEITTNQMIHIIKSLCKLVWQTSTPMIPRDAKPSWTSMSAPIMYIWPPNSWTASCALLRGQRHRGSMLDCNWVAASSSVHAMDAKWVIENRVFSVFLFFSFFSFFKCFSDTLIFMAFAFMAFFIGLHPAARTCASQSMRAAGGKRTSSSGHKPKRSSSASLGPDTNRGMATMRQLRCTLELWMFVWWIG